MRTFALYNALGGVVWVLTFSVLGYVFGRNLPRLIHYIGRVSLLAAIFIALVAGLVFLWRWFERNRGTVVASLDQRYELKSTSGRMEAIQDPSSRRVAALVGGATRRVGISRSTCSSASR